MSTMSAATKQAKVKKAKIHRRKKIKVPNFVTTQAREKKKTLHGFVDAGLRARK